MNKQTNQQIIKGASIIVGMFGVFLILGSSYMVIKPIKEANYPFVLFLLLGALFGIAMIWTAYQTLYRYSATSIQSLSAIMAIMLVGPFVRFAEPKLDKLSDSSEVVLMIISNLAPLIALIIVYRSLVSFIKWLTLDIHNN